jgi:hypothetical protein
MLTAYILLGVIIVLAVCLLVVGGCTKQRAERIADLRNKNADLIDDNRVKAEALQKLVDASEALLNHDVYHTAETLNELLESGFFETHTLLDANAVDAATDWFTLERFLERLEAAREAAQT